MSRGRAGVFHDSYIILGRSSVMLSQSSGDLHERMNDRMDGRTETFSADGATEIKGLN